MTISLTCELFYHKDPTTAFEIEVRKFRFGIGENPHSPLFDHGQTGDDLFILPRDSRNPDICAFTRVHTRVVDLPALWLDAISNLLFDILDCSQAVRDTAGPPNFEDDLKKSVQSLATVTQEFYETSLRLTALRPPGAAFWDLIDYRRLAATTFSEIRTHLREARSWFHTTTSSCTTTNPGRSAVTILQAAAKSAQEHVSSVCRQSAAPGRALLALKHLRGELGSQLQDYDSILSTIRSFLIQEIDYEEAREDIQHILGHHNKALIQTIEDCVLPDLRNIAEEIFPVGLKQKNSQGDNQSQVSTMDDALPVCPSDGDFLETRQRSVQFSSGFPNSALSPSQEGSAQLCCNYPECTDKFGWPNRYFTRRADLRRHFVEIHNGHAWRRRGGSVDVVPGFKGIGNVQVPIKRPVDEQAIAPTPHERMECHLTSVNDRCDEEFAEEVMDAFSANEFATHLKIPDGSSGYVTSADKTPSPKTTARIEQNAKLAMDNPTKTDNLQFARFEDRPSNASDAQLLPQADLRQLRSTDGLQTFTMSAMFGAECDRRPPPRNSFKYGTGPGSYGERTVSSPYAVDRDDHYHESLAALDQYGQDDDMWIDPQEPGRRMPRHDPAGRVSNEDLDRYGPREGFSRPSVPLSYSQSRDSMACDSQISRAEFRRDFPIKDRETNRGDSMKYGRSHDMGYNRSGGDPRRAVEDRVPIYSSRTNDYFLPGEGIGREVIQMDICRFVAFEVPSYHETLKQAGIWGTTLLSGLIGMPT